MKQFLIVLAVIVSVAAAAAAVLKFLPETASIREDFTCE